MIEYRESIAGLTPTQLDGFFVGWPKPPSPSTHLEILRRSAHVVVAVDTSAGRAVGFINAISDGVLAAYIPLVEVLPPYQRRGIGSELVRRMVERLDHLYMIDLVCDESVGGFYDRLGFPRVQGRALRNQTRQDATR